jgi:sulfite exporter TauE/SafE/copper chaperone CopZ
MQKVTLHVVGMHCKACKLLVEDVLNGEAGIKNAQVDLSLEQVFFDLEEGKTMTAVLSNLNNRVSPYGYSLLLDRPVIKVTDTWINWQALIIGSLLLMLFFVLQKTGILNFGFNDKVTPTTSFMIGVVASLSSCLAVVGGLILALSAKVAKDDINNRRAIYLFHFGRLLGFAVFGGMLGLIGGVLGMSMTIGAIIGLLAAVIMILLGLNLVGIWKKGIITLPSSTSRFIKNIEHKVWAPTLLGASTFFLPCGFTQAMQIVALSSGSFISGSLIMLAFAFGTLPVLFALSFGSISFARSKYAPLFFKTAGVVVIGLGVFAFLAGLISLGVISPLFMI